MPSDLDPGPGARPAPDAPTPAAPGPGRWSRLDRPPLDVHALRQALVPTVAGLDVIEEVPSTNAELAARAATGHLPDLTVLTTEHQTAGRGRLGRAWSTPPRSALATSLLVRPGDRCPAPTWGWLPLLTGLAVTRALRDVAGVRATVKWPNDVLVPLPAGAGGTEEAPAKVCGILCERITTPQGAAVVIGYGLNVSQAPEDLPVDTATSLVLAGAATIDRDTLLRATLREIVAWVHRWRDADGDATACGLADAVRESCSTLGRSVRVHLPHDEPLDGTATGVDEDGRLLVTVPGEDGPRAVSAGDVVHVRPRPDDPR